MKKIILSYFSCLPLNVHLNITMAMGWQAVPCIENCALSCCATSGKALVHCSEAATDRQNCQNCASKN